jgi:hypothetical protein
VCREIVLATSWEDGDPLKSRSIVVTGYRRDDQILNEYNNSVDFSALVSGSFVDLEKIMNGRNVKLFTRRPGWICDMKSPILRGRRVNRRPHGHGSIQLTGLEIDNQAITEFVP